MKEDPRMYEGLIADVTTIIAQPSGIVYPTQN